MLKTTLKGATRLTALLGLAGLLSCGTSSIVRAQDSPRAGEPAVATPDNGQDRGNYAPQDPRDDRYQGDDRYEQDDRDQRDYPADNNQVGTYDSRGHDSAGPRGNPDAPDDDNSAGAPDTDVDPPSRVAQLSYLDGSVSMQPGGSGDWASAARNRPITAGDKLWVDKDARAELQAGQATIHLGGMTALSFLNLDRTITQIRLAEGSINFRVRELREGDTYEVDTPNAAFTVHQAGAFRIDVVGKKEK